MGDSDSDDSDGEGGMGNVNRLLVRPPGHSGKAKKGHLCFDASYETGNLGRVDLVNDLEYDLFIRPDTCNPRHRFWFNFTVDNFKIDQRVIFNVVNISISQNVFRHCLVPIVKSTSRQKWQRMPKNNVWYHKSPAHRGHYILSFAFCFDKEDDVFQFALTHPYSYSRLQGYLSNLERKALGKIGHFKRELLAQSVQKRNVDIISIGQATSTGQTKKRVIILIARTHAGESPSSFVCQGILDFMISDHPAAETLRANVLLKIVPMLNPDGVFLGNYKSTVMGYDLNRAWMNATEWSHPSLFALIQLIKRIDRSEAYQLDFVIDIHAHASLNGCFIYGNTYDDIYRYERHIVFPKLLSHNAEDYSPENTMFNSDTNKSGTCRRYLCVALSDQVNCYTFNVSFGGYFGNKSKVLTPYTTESYKRLGRNFTRTFIDYYKLIGVLSVIPAASKLSLKKRPKSQQSLKRDHAKTRPVSRSERKRLSLHCASISGDFLNGQFDKNLLGYQATGKTTSHVSRVDEFRNKTQKLKQKAVINSRVQRNNANEVKHTTSSNQTYQSQMITLPPKPCLSIINFNELKIGSEINKRRWKDSRK